MSVNVESRKNIVVRPQTRGVIFYAFLALLLAVALAGCTSGTPPAAEPSKVPDEQPEATPVAAGPAEVPRERTVIYGWQEDDKIVTWDTFNPYIPGVNFSDGRAIIYEPMAYWNPFADEEIMWMAESYEYNDDFTELTVNLRPGIKFSDGMPLTSEDVVFTINTARELGDLVNNGGALQASVKDAVATTEQTFVITMNQPEPRFFWDFFTGQWCCSTLVIMPKHILEGKDWSTFTFFDLDKGWPVGTGPMKVAFASQSEQFFDRRDDWWAVEAGLTDPLEVERYIYQALGSDQTRITELLTSNQIDVAELNPATVGGAMQSSDALTSHTGSSPPYCYTDHWVQTLWLNHNQPPFDNVDVRWGISYLIDRQQIVDVGFGGNSIVTEVPWPPFSGLLEYTDHISDLLEQYPSSEYNPDKAAERLKKAGYEKNADGMWVDSNGETLKLTLQAWDAWTGPGQVLVEQLDRGGIDAEFTMPPDAWDQYGAGTYTAFPAGNAGARKDPYGGLVNFITDGAGGTGWSNAEYDAIMEEMAQTSPNTAAPRVKELTHDAMAIFLEELPALPIAHWMHCYPMNQTYWSGWPSVDNAVDGNYMNVMPAFATFPVVLMHLTPSNP